MTLAPGLLLLRKHLVSRPLSELALAVALIAFLIVIATLAEDAAAIDQRICFYDISRIGCLHLMAIEANGWVCMQHIYLALSQNFYRILRVSTEGYCSFWVQMTHIGISGICLLILLNLLTH